MISIKSSRLFCPYCKVIEPCPNNCLEEIENFNKSDRYLWEWFRDTSCYVCILCFQKIERWQINFMMHEDCLYEYCYATGRYQFPKFGDPNFELFVDKDYTQRFNL